MVCATVSAVSLDSSRIIIISDSKSVVDDFKRRTELLSATKGYVCWGESSTVLETCLMSRITGSVSKKFLVYFFGFSCYSVGYVT